MVPERGDKIKIDCAEVRKTVLPRSGCQAGPPDPGVTNLKRRLFGGRVCGSSRGWGRRNRGGVRGAFLVLLYAFATTRRAAAALAVAVLGPYRGNAADN